MFVIEMLRAVLGVAEDGVRGLLLAVDAGVILEGAIATDGTGLRD